MNDITLKLAVRKAAARLKEIDGYHELDTLPKKLSVYVWRFAPHRPAVIEVDIVAYGDRLVEPPLVVAWNEAVAPCTSLREIKAIENGRPKYGPPEPNAKVQVVCGCGERRFIPLNSRHQVSQCRVCAAITKKRTKAVRQFYRRRSSSSSARAQPTTQRALVVPTSTDSRQSSPTSV